MEKLGLTYSGNGKLAVGQTPIVIEWHSCEERNNKMYEQSLLRFEFNARKFIFLPRGNSSFNFHLYCRRFLLTFLYSCQTNEVFLLFIIFRSIYPAACLVYSGQIQLILCSFCSVVFICSANHSPSQFEFEQITTFFDICRLKY